MATPRQNIDEMASNQASKYITFNDALRHVDAKVMPVVQDKDAVTSPAVSSSDYGKCYIVAGIGGDWSTFSVDDIAQYYDDAWYNFVPEEGWLTWVADENEYYYYDGSDWKLLSEVLTKFGDVDAGNYTEIESDGTIKFNGNATVWKDDNFGTGRLALGVSAPDSIDFDSTDIEVLAFDGNATTEEVSGSGEIQHDYKNGSDIVPHIHWFPTTADAGDVVWQLELLIKQGTTVKYSGTLSVTSSATGTAWEEIKVNFPTLSGIGATISDQYIFRLFRDPTHSSDDYTHDAGIFTVGFHYEIDTIGSRQITTK